jgi:hypothetical protein
MNSRNSVLVVEARQQSKPPPWKPVTESRPKESDASLRKTATERESILCSKAGRDQGRAADILNSLLERRGMRDIADQVWKAQQVHASKLDSASVDSIAGFVGHHPCKGSREGHVQQALDAVATAITFGPTAAAYQISARVDCSKQKVGNFIEQGKSMLLSKSPYAAKERKIRDDSVRGPAMSCVREFCHSLEGSMIDTTDNGPKNVWNEETKQKEPHHRRIFHEATLKGNHANFERSNIYEQFKHDHPGKTIGVPAFNLSLCKYS